MKKLFLCSSLLLVLLGCNNIPTTTSTIDECQQYGINIDHSFENARVNGCTISADNQVTIKITPENEPINNSPWYAFKASSTQNKQISVFIDYKGGDHRYSPKVSIDGEHWHPIKHSLRRGKLKFKLDIGSTPIIVAGQEIITNSAYDGWMKELANDPSVTYSILGKSTQGRDIGQLEVTQPGNKEWLILTGRMHPPEVTGALAMLPFVENILGNSEQAIAFRARFNLLVLPNLNPDGVALGNWRHNANGVDLNRDWRGFKQIEARLVHDKLQAITTSGGNIVFAADFHSTHKDIFYTMPSSYGLNPPHLVEEWLGELERVANPFVVRQKPGNNPDKGVFKQYIADTYKVHAITYEMGDSTDRNVIKSIADKASNTLMEKLISTPKTAFYQEVN